jgi:hypothetical protein
MAKTKPKTSKLITRKDGIQQHYNTGRQVPLAAACTPSSAGTPESGQQTPSFDAPAAKSEDFGSYAAFPGVQNISFPEVTAAELEALREASAPMRARIEAGEDLDFELAAGAEGNEIFWEHGPHAEGAELTREWFDLNEVDGDSETVMLPEPECFAELLTQEGRHADVLDELAETAAEALGLEIRDSDATDDGQYIYKLRRKA